MGGGDAEAAPYMMVAIQAATFEEWSEEASCRIWFGV